MLFNKICFKYSIQIHTPSSVIIRHMSMSLFIVPKPLIVDPTMYSPQSTIQRNCNVPDKIPVHIQIQTSAYKYMYPDIQVIKMALSLRLHFRYINSFSTESLLQFSSYKPINVLLRLKGNYTICYHK